MSVPESYTADGREYEGSSYVIVEDLSGETFGDDFRSSDTSQSRKKPCIYS